MSLASCSLGLEAPDVDLAASGQVPGLEGGAKVAVVRLRNSSGHPDSCDLEFFFYSFGGIECTFPATPG